VPSLAAGAGRHAGAARLTKCFFNIEVEVKERKSDMTKAAHARAVDQFKGLLEVSEIAKPL